MLQFEETDVEAFPADDLLIPRIRLTTAGVLPDTEIKVGDHAYSYDRSFPIKGHSATLPKYLNEQVSAGKQPLLIERTDRFYVYFEK